MMYLDHYWELEHCSWEFWYVEEHCKEYLSQHLEHWKTVGVEEGCRMYLGCIQVLLDEVHCRKYLEYFPCYSPGLETETNNTLS